MTFNFFLLVLFGFSGKNKPAGGGHEDDGEPSEASRNVSTEEQGPDGDLPSADWDNLNDQTDDRHLYLSKFESYFKMLELLQLKHHCQVAHLGLRKLPSIGKCKKHLLEPNMTPRCMSVDLVTTGFKRYYLLEVDTSDASKALSTKIIDAKAAGDLEPHLFEIETRLLKKSLSWPKEYLDQMVGKQNHSWIAHQQSSKSGVLTDDEIVKWAARFHAKLQNLD